MDYANLCCILKVNPRCGACKGHTIEILNTIEGVYDVTMDAESETVKIRGEVNPNQCVKALARCGVHAELVWAKVTHPKMMMSSSPTPMSWIRRSSNTIINDDDYAYDCYNNYNYSYGPSGYYDNYRRSSAGNGMWQVNPPPPLPPNYSNECYNYGQATLDYYAAENSRSSFCSIM